MKKEYLNLLGHTTSCGKQHHFMGGSALAKTIGKIVNPKIGDDEAAASPSTYKKGGSPKRKHRFIGGLLPIAASLAGPLLGGLLGGGGNKRGGRIKGSCKRSLGGLAKRVK